MLLDASPTAAEGSVGKVWSGWVEAEKFGQDDLELIVGESGLHVFDAIDVWQAGDMVKE